MTYYNAIVLTTTGDSIKLHQITQPKNLVRYYQEQGNLSRVFFYRLPTRKSKSGRFCGYWNPSKGLVIGG